MLKGYGIHVVDELKSPDVVRAENTYKWAKELANGAISGAGIGEAGQGVAQEAYQKVFAEAQKRVRDGRTASLFMLIDIAYELGYLAPLHIGDYNNMLKEL